MRRVRPRRFRQPDDRPLGERASGLRRNRWGARVGTRRGAPGDLGLPIGAPLRETFDTGWKHGAEGLAARVHLHLPTVGKCKSVGIGSTLCGRNRVCRTQFIPSPEDRSVGSAPHRTSTGEGRRLRDDDRRARSTTRRDTPLGRDGSDVLADVSEMARIAESMDAYRILNTAASPKGHRILTQCRNRSAGEPSMS